MARSPKVLVVSDTIPRPDTASGDRRFFGILRILARTHEVDLLIRPGLEPDAGRYVELLKSIHVRTLQWNTIRETLARKPYDLIFAEFYHPGRAVLREIGGMYHRVPLVIDSVDVHFAREQCGAAIGAPECGDPGATKLAELEAYRGADAVLVVTAEDDALLEQESGVAPRFLVPNIVPMRPRINQERGRDVLFIGNFRHPPNIDGITWFVAKVWAKVLASVPNARLLIVGSNPPAEVSALAVRHGVNVVGYVPDTGPYLDRASVSVAPLRYGGGMKGKVSEALASGLPVVTTSVGAQGFNAVSGTHLFVADSADEYAARIVQLLEDPVTAEQMGAAGRSLVEGLCSEEVVARRVEEMAAALIRPRTWADNLRWTASAGRYKAEASARRFARATRLGRLLRKVGLRRQAPTAG